MKEAKVTFIMPAYNAGRYIGEAIESLLAQTMSDWKLIVMDDGSTDSTRAIVSRFAAEDPRISLHEMDSPSGSAYQPRKKAILESDTPFVAPLDADDSVEPEYLEKLWQTHEATSADMVYPVMVTDKGALANYDEFEGKVFQGRDCVKFTLNGWKINCNGGIIRKEIYENAYRKFGGDLKYSYADELLTRQLLILAPKVAFVPARYYYRYNPDSITHKVSRKSFDYIRCHLDLKRLISEVYGKESEEYRGVTRQLFYDYFLTMELLEAQGIEHDTQRYGFEEMMKCRHSVDRNKIKGGVSRRLSLLFPLPPKLASRFLRRWKKFFLPGHSF